MQSLRKRRRAAGGFQMKRKTLKKALCMLLALAALCSALPAAFAADGAAYCPIYLGDARLDYAVDQILAELPLDGKSSAEKIRLAYDWVITHCVRSEWDGTVYYDAAAHSREVSAYGEAANSRIAGGSAILRPDYKGTELDDHGFFYGDSNSYIAYYAEEMLYKRSGNCAHFSALLAMLLNHLGFDCRIIEGVFINLDGTRSEHRWNYVLVDGTYYWLDVRIDNATYERGGRTVVPHDYFMITDQTVWESSHSWDHTYSDWLRANTAQIIQDTTIVRPWSACSQWAESYLDRADSLELIPACLRGTDMRSSISRREFAALAVSAYEKLSGKSADSGGASPFGDIDDKAVTAAAKLGIVNGTGEGKFSADMMLTREQASTMLGRALALAKKKPELERYTPAGNKAFSDGAQISAYASGYVYYLASLGVIEGVGNNLFSPKTSMTREQAVKIAVGMLG